MLRASTLCEQIFALSKFFVQILALSEFDFCEQFLCCEHIFFDKKNEQFL